MLILIYYNIYLNLLLYYFNYFITPFAVAFSSYIKFVLNINSISKINYLVFYI